jgi:hypothetical protein
VQVIELLSQNVGAFSLESVNYLVRRVASIGLNEQVYMIGADRKSIDLPAMFIRHAEKHLFEPIRNFVFEHLRPTLWTPHKMVLHRVDGVTASAVWFFVDWHQSINRLRRTVFRRKSSP